MNVQQIYTSCLSQAAYFIESDGVSAVIDPLRDVDRYIKLAEKYNSKIKYVFETHFHADFVSGHLTLAKKTNAKIVFGPESDPNYDAIICKENQVFKIGKLSLTAIHTPGHTLESTSYLLSDENGNVIPIPKKQLPIKGISLSDILIIRNWLYFAKMIGDESYKKISNYDFSNKFLSDKIKQKIYNQTNLKS